MGCSVFGALVRRGDADTAADLAETWRRAKERGPDSAGLWVRPWGDGPPVRTVSTAGSDPSWPPLPRGGCAIVGNRRGEPTTEVVWDKSDADVQPFTSPGGWVVSHNGTVANDAELYAELLPPDQTPPTRIDSYAIGLLLGRYGWPDALARIRGSFALVVVHPDEPRVLRYGTNYKPLACRASRFAVQVASLEAYLEHHHDPLTDPGVRPIEPYTYGEFRHAVTGPPFTHTSCSLFDLHPELQDQERRVLVACSGGLDSGVLAWKLHAEGWDVTLLHFQWNTKAQQQEFAAVMRLAEAMFGDQAEGRVLVRDVGDFFSAWAPSPLTDPDATISKARGGEAGAEFAHEWVPARNLNFAAQATAIAEYRRYPYFAIATTNEEAGAYPDDEQIFGIRFNQLLAYAVGPYRRVRLLQPFAAYMKRHVVRDGLAVGAPMHLLWSCYEGGAVQCGSCGPCLQRQRAFRMNGVVDPAFAPA
jgi:7-cyano-7-deazaguanine synthase